MTTDNPGPSETPTTNGPAGHHGRIIDLSVTVSGTPEQVWEAIATGPGISSWYVPTQVTPEVGGEMVQVFGPGPEMTVPGTVTAWEPPSRVCFGPHGR